MFTLLYNAIRLSESSLTPHSFSTILVVILYFLISALCYVLVVKISLKTAMAYHPNYRSSHSLPAPRGGGIGIWLSFVIIGIFFFNDNAFTLIAGHFSMSSVR